MLKHKNFVLVFLLYMFIEHIECEFFTFDISVEHVGCEFVAFVISVEHDEC